MDKGAHFHCCDFQVHTPRDRKWVGEGAVSEDERRDFARRFLGACRERGLEAVAITDHHDLAFVDYLRDAAANELDGNGNQVPSNERIVVFPGMELTLAIPCQALIIFDADLPKDLFQLILNALAINQCAPGLPKCSEIVRLPYTTFDALLEALNKHEFLKGRYIVMPNVSEGGQSTLLRAGHAIHYREMSCVGGYLDGKTIQLGAGNSGILSGKNRDYGDKALGLFQTSDNRRNDFKDLGDSVTWVKWAEPTAEALRQACLARESRLSQSRPLTPMVALTSLNVSNSAFMGPVYVQFNPQFNAIIGGRGTGKSTILEYIRWALCDEPRSGEDYEGLPAYQAKRATLVEKTLTSLNGNVEVSFTVNNVAHVVRRDSLTNELVLKIADGKFQACTEADIRNLLPVQAYSQKQLSSVAVRLEELLRFIHAPIRKELDNINSSLNGLAAEIRKVYDSIQKQRLTQNATNKEERELGSLREQVAAIRRGLKGLGKRERELLSEYSAHEKEEEVVHGWLEDIGRANSAIAAATKSLMTLPKAVSDLDALPNGNILGKMQSEMASLLENVGQTLASASTTLKEFGTDDSAFSRLKVSWQIKHDEYELAYKQVKEKSSTHEATLKQLADLEERQKELRASLASKRAELRDMGRLSHEFAELREQWCSLHETRSEAIRIQCENLTNISGSRIRATLKKGAIVDEVSQKMRARLTGAKIRGDKIDDLCRDISNSEQPVRKYREIIDELHLLALYDSDEKKTVFPSTPILTSLGFTNAELVRIAEKLTVESWLELYLTQLGDRPVFEYQRKEDEYIAFEHASAGQQATSLLWALLNQSGPPLIIDQPEDDLDNRMIFEIVEQIWNAKQRRQLIFASHNANIVVNGDADLVVCCDYRVVGQQSGGCIKHEGAIDVKDVRSEITRVTEGGRDAFKRRKDKYGF